MTARSAVRDWRARAGALRSFPWRDRSHLLPVAIAVVYLIVMVGELRYLVTATNWNSDSASSSVIAESLGAQPGRPSVVLGQFGWYVTLWFDLATKWLPGHRQIWQAAPYAMALGGIALIAWSSLRVAGRRAAAITAAALVCGSPAVLANLFSPTLHTTTWFALSVLVASMVFAVTRDGAARLSFGLAVAFVAGAVAGACAASDPLLWLAGIAPLVASTAAGALVARGPAVRRLLASTGVTVAAAIVAAVVAGAIMRGQGFTVMAPATRFAGIDEIGRNAVLLAKVVLHLGNGYFPAKPINARGVLTVVCALIAVAGLAAPLLLLRRVLGERTRGTQPERGMTRLAFASYWAAVVVLLVVAFIFSTFPLDVSATRYVIPLVFAVAAAAPLLAEGSWRKQTLVVAAVTVFATANLISLANRDVTAPAIGVRLHQDEIVRFLERERLTVGYAGYWNAASFTWQSRFRFEVYPVWECPGQPTLCPFFFHSVSTWYRPRANHRTFLIVDPLWGWVTRPPAPAFGRPARVLRAGQVTVYVFGYDIASRFGPRVRPPPAGTPAE
jgi:hypothetical protein